jgi:Cu-processing system ATP-binding protein
MLMVNREYSADDVIALMNVSKYYGKLQALQALDLSIKEGECLALIGHNGAGKTTLLKLILGLTRPSKGSVTLWGEAPAIHTARQEGHSLGFLPEAVVFKGNMSGREVLHFYAQLKNVARAECHDLLETVELTEVADHKVATYSKGMRQRLGLAQALLGDPQLLVLDEPTSGLDPFFRRKFYQIIRERQAAGSTVLLSSHSLTEIEAQTDRIAIMKEGKLVTQGSMDELRQQAELSLTVRITLKEDNVNGLASLLDSSFEYQKINEHVYDVKCRNGDKMAVLKQLALQQDELIQDLDIRPPGLDDLFIHFAGKEDHA